MPGQRSFDFDQIFQQPGPLTVACGLGVDSVAMIIEMIRRGYRPDLITFADTGNEWPETYEYLEIFNAYLKRHGFPLVTVVRYVPQRFKHGQYGTLGGNCFRNKTLPSLAFGRKSCSLKWKAEPQERYITKHWGPGKKAVADGTPIRRLIGYDAGKKDQRRGAVKPNPIFQYSYPLRTWGLDREDCIQVIKNAGLPVPRKSACTFCPSTTPAELRILARIHPDLAAGAIAMEDNARPNFKKIDGLWRNGTKTRPGSWRQYLEDKGLLPDLKPYHSEERNTRELMPPPIATEIYPYLHVFHYQDPAKEEGDTLMKPVFGELDYDQLYMEEYDGLVLGDWLEDSVRFPHLKRYKLEGPATKCMEGANAWFCMECSTEVPGAGVPELDGCPTCDNPEDDDDEYENAIAV